MYKELKDNQKDVLKALLLAPISVENGYKYKASLKEHENDLIYKNDNWFCYTNNSSEQSDNGKKIYIVSKQKYCGTKDADMSNIAVAFYESLYEISMLDNEKNDFKNKAFAGDTMNTYKIVERYASNKKKEEWKSKYHCLANFWLLPFEVGRTNKSSGKLCKGRAIRPAETVKNFNKGTKDYMDRFLDQLSKNKGEYNKTFPEYFKRFTIGDLVNNDLSEFGKAHFLNDIYISNGNVIHFSTIESDKPKLSSVNVDKVISCMEENIMERAKAIVNSPKARVLYRTFKNLCDSIPEEMLKTE